MDTYDDTSDASYGRLLTEDEQDALRSAVLRRLGAMPFGLNDKITRSLWVMYIGPRGVRTRATLPVDNRLDMPDATDITGMCDLTGSLISGSPCHDGEQAMIALRRPGPAEISGADAHIFRLVREAVAGQAAAGQGTATWIFHVVGPDGIQEVTSRTLSELGHA